MYTFVATAYDFKYVLYSAFGSIVVIFYSRTYSNLKFTLFIMLHCYAIREMCVDMISYVLSYKMICKSERIK